MKKIKLCILLVLVCCSVCWGDELIISTSTDRADLQVLWDDNGHWEYNTYWEYTEIIAEGKTDCIHSWAYSKARDPQPNVGCCVFHPDGVCSWHFPERFKICRNCKREIKETNITKSTWIPEPPSEYELIKSSIQNK